MIVLDASAAFELLLRTNAGEELSARLRGSPLLHAPHLLDVEVTSSLRRVVAAGMLSAQRAHDALDDFWAMRIVRHPHLPFLDRVWELRDNFSAYDAYYLALAEALDATLLTCDSALRSARLSRGKVEVL